MMHVWSSRWFTLIAGLNWIQTCVLHVHNWSLQSTTCSVYYDIQGYSLTLFTVRAQYFWNPLLSLACQTHNYSTNASENLPLQSCLECLPRGANSSSSSSSFTWSPAEWSRLDESSARRRIGSAGSTFSRFPKTVWPCSVSIAWRADSRLAYLT
jgi:hypothetical protein